MTIIARTFATREDAEKAGKDLYQTGYRGSVHMIDSSAASPTDAIAQAGVDRAHAALYAERVHAGETILVIDPPWGQGQAANEVLDRNNPVPVQLPDPHPLPGETHRSAAPLSALMGWPVLSSDPAPLSHRIRMRTILPEPQHSKTSDSVRKLSADPAPLSNKVKLPTLSANPAPLSRAASIPTLSNRPAPLSDRLGWRTLLNSPSPLSDRLGWKTLLNTPAPLSQKLGMPVLSKDAAPLSHSLHLGVLTKED